MRLIDKDALIDEIKHTLWDWESVDGIKSSTVLKQTISDINNMSTVDAEPIVRCKDCRYNWVTSYNHGVQDEPRCNFTSYKHSLNDYCSRGERRDR